MQAYVVGFRIMVEAYGFDVGETFEQSLADSVHAVHHTAVAGEMTGKARSQSWMSWACSAI